MTQSSALHYLGSSRGVAGPGPAASAPLPQPRTAPTVNVATVFPISPLPVRRRRAILRFLVHALAGAAAGGALAAQEPAQATVPQWGRASAGMQLPWLATGDAQARLALGLLRGAEADGLDPGRYGVADLARRLDTARDAASVAAFEQDLSAAMVRFLADLHFGRSGSVYRSPADTPDAFDPAASLARALKERRLVEAVEAAAPAIPLYRRVKAALARYRELAGARPDWPALPPVDTGVAEGDAYEGAALLLDRLQLLGDLGKDAAAGNAHTYTPQLAAALRRFQSRHGLAEDGVLGAQTLAALSVPPARRAAQLALTLERLRWLPQLPPGRVVAVNLPTYRLWAFDGTNDASVAPLEMRIIVGTAARTPTPLFIGQMRYLEFNPYWNVPHSIALAEIVPKLARNPAYLRQNDMELVSADGGVLRATAAGALDALRAGRARVRQRPGALNALGAVKFAMPNPMNIYLHSTSSRELFNRARRDLSHGCIRVERPVELAEFVLANAREWGAAAVQAAMESGRTRRLALPRPVPVVLFYATAVTDRAGRALFAQDIYGRDEPLIEAMRAPR